MQTRRDAIAGTLCTIVTDAVSTGATVLPDGWPRWLEDTLRRVRSEHLQVYLDEYVFRFNRHCMPMAAFQTLQLRLSARVWPASEI